VYLKQNQLKIDFFLLEWNSKLNGFDIAL
jgi:hypothetical protein